MNFSKCPIGLASGHKVRIALDWTLDLLFSKDLVQFVTLRSPTMSRPENNSRPADRVHVSSVKSEVVVK